MWPRYRAFSWHLLFWLVLAVIAVLNGIARTETYGRYLPDLTAHQLSTLTGILATGAATWMLWKYRPLDSTRRAWAVGAAWLVMTIAFEFTFGRFVAGHSWQRLIADYHILEGRIWILFLLWIFLLPWICFQFTTASGSTSIDDG